MRDWLFSLVFVLVFVIAGVVAVVVVVVKTNTFSFSLKKSSTYK